tara:strand:+ start:8727 stop:11657 length:2931 start_codon:yes stop_codon:yes gene_type:complete
MPKEIYKLDRFHGGLNTNADPRDIEENELSKATDIMVDEIGTIRTLGSGVNHEAFTATSNRPFSGAISAGYGLFHWSSDRKGAHVKQADLSGTHTGADSATNMIDTSANFPIDGLIGARINNLTDGSSGTITDNTDVTVIVGSLSGGSDNSFDDAANDAYTIDSFPTTGDNYIAFSDADATGTVSMYSFASDTWGETVTGLTNVDGGNREDVFHAVDGQLRICDSNFENTNSNQWYGYIDEVFFKSVSDTVIVNQWYQAPAMISPPDDTSEFDNIEPTDITYTSTGGNLSLSADTGTRDETPAAVLNAAGVLNMVGGIEVTVRITTASYSGTAYPDELICGFTITTGSYTIASDLFNGVVGVSHKTDNKTEYATGTSGATKDITYTFEFGDNYLGSGSLGDDFGASETGTGIGTTLTNFVQGGKVASAVLTNIKVTEAVVDSANTQAKLTAENVFMQILQKTPSDTTNMIPRGWDKEWEYGLSFIYDGKQESLVRTLFDSSNSNKTLLDNTDGAAKCPQVKLYIDAGQSTFNRRKTGAVWYIREASGGDSANEWTAQIEYDFIKGVARVVSSGNETDCRFNFADGNQYEFTVDRDHLLSPNLVDTYFSRTGVSNTETSINARYKTSALVNRKMYVGNVLITKDDGTTEVKADAMLKSPVNSFDVFPSLSIVEAAVNDGESIIALEEFADRILQFKENSLYIINVAQGTEFLEETYKYKGVSQPSSVCKTDYGIAWANKYGCFFYDGREVRNLLEKKGMNKIKDHGTNSWETFSSDNPMIAYLPKKRQLLLVDGNTSSADGDVLIYDMVTQSWIKGGDGTLVMSSNVTNFITDVNGNLVWSAISGGSTLTKWDDDSATTAGMVIETKDIDFGEPGRRKKLYKVLITYDTGNATSNVQVDYDVDGGTTFPYDFANGTNFSSTELASANGWRVAELKPDVSSESNNIKSFRLRFATDGTVPAGFRINDISCVYRMKPPR